MSEHDDDLTHESRDGETPDTTETPDAAGAAAGAQEGAQAGSVAFPYAAAGAAFTAWFNDRVGRLHNATLKLGTKTATVRELHADGRLEVSLHASAGESEQQFVAFEAQYLD